MSAVASCRGVVEDLGAHLATKRAICKLLEKSGAKVSEQPKSAFSRDTERLFVALAAFDGRQQNCHDFARAREPTQQPSVLGTGGNP